MIVAITGPLPKAQLAESSFRAPIQRTRRPLAAFDRKIYSLCRSRVICQLAWLGAIDRVSAEPFPRLRTNLDD